MSQIVDIDRLDTTELIDTYFQIIIQLKKREVIMTKNLLGDLAEYLVIDYFPKHRLFQTFNQLLLEQKI